MTAFRRRLDQPDRMAQDLAGDPLYRDAIARLQQVLSEPSPSGRYCVLVEEPLITEQPLFCAMGPFGRNQAIDVAASVTSDEARRIGRGELVVRVVPWAARAE